MSIFTKKIEAYASELGWIQGLRKENDRVFRFNYNMGEGRSQMVLICYHCSDENPDKGIVEVSSPAMKMDGLPGGKLGAQMAEKLLRENGRSIFTNWAIEDLPSEGRYLIATSRWLIEGLDAEELDIAANVVAAAADKMEKTLGVDNF